MTTTTIVLHFPRAQSSVLASCSMASLACSWEEHSYSNDHRWPSVFVCLFLQLLHLTIRLLSSLSPLLLAVRRKLSSIPNKNQLINLNIKERRISLIMGVILFQNSFVGEFSTEVILYFLETANGPKII